MIELETLSDLFRYQSTDRPAALLLHIIGIETTCTFSHSSRKVLTRWMTIFIGQQMGSPSHQFVEPVTDKKYAWVYRKQYTR